MRVVGIVFQTLSTLLLLSFVVSLVIQTMQLYSTGGSSTIDIFPLYMYALLLSIVTFLIRIWAGAMTKLGFSLCVFVSVFTLAIMIFLSSGMDYASPIISFCALVLGIISVNEAFRARKSQKDSNSIREKTGFKILITILVVIVLPLLAFIVALGIATS